MRSLFPHLAPMPVELEVSLRGGQGRPPTGEAWSPPHLDNAVCDYFLQKDPARGLMVLSTLHMHVWGATGIPVILKHLAQSASVALMEAVLV